MTAAALTGKPCCYCGHEKMDEKQRPACGVTGARLTFDEMFWSSKNCINWKLKQGRKRKHNETLADSLF